MKILCPINFQAQWGVTWCFYVLSFPNKVQAHKHSTSSHSFVVTGRLQNIDIAICLADFGYPLGIVDEVPAGWKLCTHAPQNTVITEGMGARVVENFWRWESGIMGPVVYWSLWDTHCNCMLGIMSDCCAVHTLWTPTPRARDNPLELLFRVQLKQANWIATD